VLVVELVELVIEVSPVPIAVEVLVEVDLVLVEPSLGPCVELK
jgi:hypothetical protein